MAIVDVAAPMAGSVWEILVEAGQSVAEGEELMILESMKMEISVYAPRDGYVERMLCATGQLVAAGQPLILLR